MNRQLNSIVRLSLWIGLVMMLVVFSAATKTKEQVRWRNPEQLTASDFRRDTAGRRVKVKTGKRTWRVLEGYIYSGIAYRFEQKGSDVRYEVYAFMLPDESWLSDPENRGTLRHEQAHFNITEIHARKLRESLLKVRNPEEAKRKYKQVITELAKTQADFDADHMGESDVTEHWQRKIQRELNERSAFAAAVVIPPSGR